MILDGNGCGLYLEPDLKMENKITVRLAKPEEAEKAIKWLIANSEHNNFDLDSVTYKSTMLLCAENGTPKVFLPVQVSLVMDSLGPDPAIGHRDQVVALDALLQASRNLAQGLQVGEIYFIGSDPEVNRQAELRGFEQIKLPVYRLKVNDARS